MRSREVTWSPIFHLISIFGARIETFKTPTGEGSRMCQWPYHLLCPPSRCKRGRVMVSQHANKDDTKAARFISYACVWLDLRFQSDEWLDLMLFAHGGTYIFSTGCSIMDMIFTSFDFKPNMLGDIEATREKLSSSIFIHQPRPIGECKISNKIVLKFWDKTM